MFGEFFFLLFFFHHHFEWSVFFVAKFLVFTFFICSITHMQWNESGLRSQKDDRKREEKKNCAIFRKQNICTICHFHRVFVVVVVVVVFFFFAHVSVPKMLIFDSNIDFEFEHISVPFCKYQKVSRLLSIENGSLNWIKCQKVVEYWYFEIVYQAVGIFDSISLFNYFFLKAHNFQFGIFFFSLGNTYKTITYFSMHKIM